MFSYDPIDLELVHLTTWLCCLSWKREAFPPQDDPKKDASPLWAINLLQLTGKGRGKESEEWAVKLGKWPPSPQAAREKAFRLTFRVFRKKRIHSFHVTAVPKKSLLLTQLSEQAFWWVTDRVEAPPSGLSWKYSQRMSLENQRQGRKQRCVQCRKREPKAKTTHAQSLSVPPVAHRSTSLKDVFFHASLLKDLPSISGKSKG